MPGLDPLKQPRGNDLARLWGYLSAWMPNTAAGAGVDTSMPTPLPLSAGVPAASGRTPGRLVSAQHAVAVLLGVIVLASTAVLVPLSNLARQPISLTGSSIFVLILAFALVGFVLA